MKEAAPKKIPYVPSQEYRYELSEDEFSRKRFRVLMEIYKELQGKLPMVPISFCMYGSLVKGKILTPETAPDTDIDLEVKYDEEIYDIKTSREKRRLTGKLEFYIEEVILKKIYETDRIHLAVNPINSKSIWIAIHNISTDKSKLPNMRNNVDLANYFTLSIGEAVKKYRDKFLKELATMQNTEDAEEAEKIWNTIKKCVEEVERQGKIPEKIRKQFPQTTEEALKFYEVK